MLLALTIERFRKLIHVTRDQKVKLRASPNRKNKHAGDNAQTGPDDYR